MKKLASLLICVSCLSVAATAQSVRIGSLEFSVKKSRDTVAQAELPENDTSEKKPFEKFHKSLPFGGFGFILPNVGSGHYTTLGGKSVNIDLGWLHRYQIAPRFALLLSSHYSYYNYKLHDASSEPTFLGEVLRGKVYASDDIEKQVFRSHNLAIGGWMRYYIVPPHHRRNDGIFVDLGLQGDWAFSKHYILYTEMKKNKYKNDYAFNAFPAYAVARVGWRSSALFARYRLTDAFNSKALPMDLPRLTIGIHFM